MLEFERKQRILAETVTQSPLYQQLARKKHRTRDELIAYLRLQNLLEKSQEDLRAWLVETATNAGAQGIVQALQSGLLELHDFQKTDSTADKVNEFIQTIKDAVSAGTTYPLFDAQTGNLVRLAIATGQIAVTPVALQRGKHVALAADLLGRLPLFDYASVDEILDIRKELDGPLVRFRSAMIRFSHTIQSASWDADFTKEAERIFYQEVEPAVLEIREAVESNPYFTPLIRTVFNKSALVSGSVFGVLISQLSSLPELAVLAFGLTAAGATAIYDYHRQWTEKAQRARQNQLFFYYKAGQRLGESSSG